MRHVLGTELGAPSLLAFVVGNLWDLSKWGPAPGTFPGASIWVWINGRKPWRQNQKKNRDLDHGHVMNEASTWTTSPLKQLLLSIKLCFRSWPKTITFDLWTIFERTILDLARSCLKSFKDRISHWSGQWFRFGSSYCWLMDIRMISMWFSDPTTQRCCHTCHTCHTPRATCHVPRATACHGPVPRSAGWDVPSWCPRDDVPKRRIGVLRHAEQLAVIDVIDS